MQPIIKFIQLLVSIFTKQPQPTPPEQPVPVQPEVQQPRPQRFCWCLDNGHGKLQKGKRSPIFDDGTTQFLEYKFNRDIVERIITRLKEEGIAYYDVVPDCETVGSFLQDRVKRANSYATPLPKIFVSIHSNAAPTNKPNEWANATGVETWYCQNSEVGRTIASIFQQNITAATGFTNRGLRDTSKSPLYVLLHTTMPAILTENGFYNNKAQAALLMKDEIRQKIADAHVDSILYIEQNGVTWA